MNYLQTVMKTLSSSKVGKFATKNAPQILLGVGVLSSAGTVATTIIATKRSLDLIDEELAKRKKETPETDISKLTAKETVKLCWKEWLVPAGFFAGSTAAFIGAFHVEHGRALTYATLLSGAESRLAALEAEMMEKIGEKKSEEIQDAAAQKIVSDKKIGSEDCDVPTTGMDGKYWCYDPISNQKFKTTFDKLSLAKELANKRLAMNGQECLGDFLVDCGGKFPNHIGMGLIWKHRRGAEEDDSWGYGYSDSRDATIGVKIRSMLDDNGEPCFYLEYPIKPEWDDAFDMG